MRKIITLGLVCFISMALAAHAVVIASDSFVADATGDAANGIYKHGGGTVTAGILKNSPNTSVVAAGFSGGWAGNGYATIQPGEGTNGHANIRLQAAVSAYRGLSDYSASLSDTYYFSMTVSADALLSASQNAYFGFANDLTSLPGEGVTKYGFMLGIEGTGSGMNLIARTRQSDSSPTGNRLMDTVVASLSANQEYNLLVRVDRSGTGGFAKDQFTLWVNPEDGAEGSNVAALAFGDVSSSSYVGFLNNDSINSFAMYSGGVDAATVVNVTVDNVMMATTFDDVYANIAVELPPPPPPPPSDVIAADPFFARQPGDAANGFYYAGENRADSKAVLGGVSNRSVIAAGFAGDWSGSGYATILPRVGNDGVVNLRMLGDTRAYRSLALYTNQLADTYYFSMSVLPQHNLHPSQKAYFGFGSSFGALIPAEGAIKYGFLMGLESTNGVIRLVARTRQSDGPSGISLKDTVVASLNVGQEYKLIIRLDRNIDSGTDGFKLWVDPEYAVETSNTPSLVFDETTTNSLFYGFVNQNDINSFAFYGEGDTNNVADIKIDNIMMAKTYDAVFTNFSSVVTPAVLDFTCSGSHCILSAESLFSQTGVPFDAVTNYLQSTSDLLNPAWTNIGYSVGTNAAHWEIPISQDVEAEFFRVILK